MPTNRIFMSIGRLLTLLILTFLTGQRAEACLPQINWSPSVSFCAGNTFTLNAFNPNCTYSWSTGATSSSITVSSSGIYHVTVTNQCGSVSDTIRVYVDQPPNVNLGADRIVCSANNPVLSVPLQSNTSYLWSNASTSNQISITQSGTYHVKVTNGCGTFRDTVNLIVADPPTVSLGPDINNCTGTTNTLSIPPVYQGNIRWKTGDTTNQITVTSPGTYWVRVINQCGTYSDTIRVDHAKGNLLDIGDTINKCPTGSVLLNANITGGTYLWNTNATTRSITANSAGMYWVQFTDNCGTYYDTVYVVNNANISVNLGPDVTICSNDNFYLDAGNPGSTYSWNTGQGSKKIKVDTAGTYWVGVNNGCGNHYDTVNISMTYAPRDSIGDTAYYCGAGHVDVNAGRWGPQSYYYWDDGYRGRIHRYSSQGNHWVRVGNECDTIQIDFYVKDYNYPGFDLGNDTVVCGPFFLETGLSDRMNSFTWSTAGSRSYQSAALTDFYWVEVKNPCGTFTDTIHVTVTGPPALAVPRSIKLCNGGAQTLAGLPNDTVTKWIWSTGQNTSSITVNNPGKYYVAAINLCDTLYDSVTVRNDYPLQVNLGPDTTLCGSQVLYLDAATYNGDSVRWSTGSRNGGLPVSQAGTYWVKVYNKCGVFMDTVVVSKMNPPLDKLTEEAFCVGGSVVVDATQPNVLIYKWNTGAQTSSITVNQPGLYWVEMTNYCGTVTDTVYVREDHPIPPFSLGNDTIFCSGTLWLDPGYIPGVQYQWQNGYQSRLHMVTKSGKYWVTASNTCNSYTDTINVLITGPPKLILGDTVKFCHGSTFTLNAQNPGSNYLWSDSSTNRYFSADTAGKYWVTITNPCGQLTDTVELVTEFPLLNLELGEDTVICRGQSLTLDAGYSNVYTKWNTGESTQQITVTETGGYTVEIANSCGIWKDSIFVEVQEVPVFSLGNDTVICNFDGSLTLEGPPGLNLYEWSNGDNSPVTTFTQPGKKWLRVANKCFEYIDTINVIGENPIELDLGEDTTLCIGESILLDPGVYDYTVTWYNGLKGGSREITRPGTYWATAQNSCGIFSDTIEVDFDYHLDPGKSDTVVCRGDSAIVDIRDAGVGIVWFDGSTKLLRTFKEEGVYPAAITNTCGTFYKDFEVNLSNCDCPLYVANAFTPNGDGVNDEFTVVHSCDISEFNLVIFNRWGQKVFETNDPDQPWRGSLNGEELPQGVYGYQLTYKWLVYGVDRVKTQKGYISILR